MWYKTVAVTSTAGRVWNWLTEPLEQRSAELDPDIWYPTIDEQLYARQQQQAIGSSSRLTIKQALGIPAVYRAVSLISSVVGSLDLQEFIGDVEIDAAPVLKRPAKAWKPSEFKRDTAMYMASRGESIWMVDEVGFDGFATSLLPLVPEQMNSEWNGREFTRWWTVDGNGRERTFRPETIKHMYLTRDPATGRGLGPLQLCGIALNAAQQAEVWASRFYLGSQTDLYMDSASPLSKGDVDTFHERWTSRPPNLPKVGHGFTPHKLTVDMESAQALEARKLTRSDAALMFGISGALMEVADSGSSIKYSNVGGLATELIRLCVGPQYLEPIEEAFSDLRPRGHEARFDVEGFQRADDAVAPSTSRVAPVSDTVPEPLRAIG